MARYVTSIFIQRRVNDTFAFISDLRNAPTWDPQTVAAYKISEGPIGSGTQFRLVGRLLGYTLDLPYKVQLYRPPYKLVFAGETAVLRYSDRITLVADGPACCLTYDARLDLKGALALANPFFPLLFRRIGRSATRRIREAVERLA